MNDDRYWIDGGRRPPQAEKFDPPLRSDAEMEEVRRRLDAVALPLAALAMLRLWGWGREQTEADDASADRRLTW